MPHVWRSEPHLILLVEPDGSALVPFRDFLSVRGVESILSESFDDARRLAGRLSFDLVVLHLTARAPGVTFVTEFAETDLPIIVVSEQEGEADRILTLERGADDYLGVPFNAHELFARIRTILRRLTRVAGSRDRSAPRQAALGDWIVNIDQRRAWRQSGERVQFTAGEMQLLAVLLRHQGDVLTREELAARTHRDASEVFERSVDVLIARVRQKLEDDRRHPTYIETVRGSGYRLTPLVSWMASGLGVP